MRLQLLNGSMKGSVLSLPEGEVTLGEGDADLLVTFDTGVSRVALRVNQQRVYLQDTVPCWVEGKRWHKRDLPLGCVIDLAGQMLVLLTTDTHFTPRLLPTRRQVRGRSVGLWFWLLTGSLLAAVPLALAALSTTASLNNFEKQDVQRWLQQPDLNGLAAVWQDDGSLRISGQCRQQRYLQPLLARLRRAGVFYRQESVCQDQLLDNVRYLLAQAGYQRLQVSAGETVGEVRITGQLRADERWQRLSKQLERLEGLQQWQVDSRGDEPDIAMLQAIKQAGLLGKISLEPQETRMIISGRLDEQQQQRLSEKLLPLAAGSQLIFQHMDPVTADVMVFFSSPIVSVGGNVNHPYLALADGRRLQTGTRLAQGAEIVNIDKRNGIDLWQDGRLIHLPFTF
ncbi:type III secretion system inner membrane ring subunit SctD [Serratia quinivorans]|uniref:type III secretion system inner membrane ring subunit SctD n=1 Tax=Serratia quinivorans TaxID=137545 RepID=UPI00217C4DB1|nr:type III secretion system inner membrane ring subunit SctD [Serratia quinivorans]CAI1011181.1 type III secretion system protein SsaD [Serratia quinivorans]CAI1811527.1 type III secretion system protein SsaD [Serratia quinivorans]